MAASSGSKSALRYLRYVLLAAETHSFRQAAAALGVQQSTISRRIRDVEDELGFALFERSSVGVRLTEAGRHYLPEVRAALRHLDQATSAIQSVALGQRGRLRLAVSEDAVTGRLARTLAAHRRRWPDVRVELVEMPPPDQAYALQSGLVDLGLMLQPIEEGGFSADPLWTEACTVALPEAHPLATKSDLQVTDFNGQLVIVGQRHRGFLCGRLVVDLLAGMGITVHVAAKVERIQTALMMVQAGIGIAFTPATLAAVPSGGAVFRHADFMQGSLTMQAVWATNDPSGLVAQFLRTAREIAAVEHADS